MRHRLAIRDHTDRHAHELPADALVTVFVLVALAFVLAAALLLVWGQRVTSESPPVSPPLPPPRPPRRQWPPPKRSPCIDSLWRVLEPGGTIDLESALKRL